MYLTKRQSLVIALGILGIFFVVVYQLVRGSQGEGRSPTPTKHTSEPSPQNATPLPQATPDELGVPQFSLKDFQRSEERDGRKAWEIHAALGEYFPAKQLLRLTHSTLWLYRKTGETVKLTSDRALVRMQGTSLSSANVQGSVTVIFDDKVTARTEEATYDQQANLLLAPGHVTITGELFDIDGDDLTLHTDSKEALLKKNVKTVIRRGLHGLEKKK